jgi:signal transduction histidine kinase
MKDNLLITPTDAGVLLKNLEAITASLEYLQKFTTEIIPAALPAERLDIALQKLITSANNTKALHFTLRTPALKNNEINGSNVFVIYMVVQELVVNILKHSSAKNAGISVTKNQDHIFTTATDDGIGFNAAILQTTAGKGYKTLEELIKSRGGSISIDTPPAKGSLVTIKIPLP